MSILVTGGAGYVGSHTVRWLRRGGLPLVVLDDLSTGHRRAVPEGVAFVQGSIADDALVQRICVEHRVDAVVHFAAKSLVGESVVNPRKYWTDNVVATHALLGSLLDAGVRKVVFSSTAAVYGEPETPHLAESHPKRPLNPYGRTKLVIEELLADYAKHGLRSIALRYFNAAGAEPDDGLGERHDPETHLVPLAIGAALGKRAPLTVFGTDYPTADGTCIRDYVHVSDLANAHQRALDRLDTADGHTAYNLGSGAGYTVKAVLDEVARVAGKPVPHSVGPRRAGDPAVLVADSSKARSELGWLPAHDLARIVDDAWRFHATSD
jgi:UDP-glucose 4-epimerase